MLETTTVAYVSQKQRHSGVPITPITKITHDSQLIWVE